MVIRMTSSMSDTTEMPVEGTRMTVPFSGPVTFTMPVWMTCTELLLLLPRPGRVANWSNSPKSSDIANRIPDELVIVELFAETTAVRFALGIGMDASSSVRFWRSCCCVELRLLAERPLMMESRSEVLTLACLYARP